ncbi:MAG TPA: glycoside hydrolase family 32 protein [Ruminiclostridium sp.]
MKLLCDSKYIILPVSHQAKKKSLKFYENNTLIYDLQVELDFINPDVKFYLNIERFEGKEIELISEPNINLKIEKSNFKYLGEEIYMGKYRSEFHFSSQRGWLNDPNGLFYYNSEYHMFYQHNPVGCKWGNMHWGHAVSKDLVHWEEKEIALYPDELGTIFSGSAIVDTKNVTGLKENENDVILLFYTAAGGDNSELSKSQHFTQCLAYSIDGGNTFKKYSKNPIVPLIESGNRDPKIIYDSETNIYIMALYLAEFRFVLLTSINLLDWKQIQEITLQDDRECPDFYPLPVDDDNKNIKWVLSGACDKYLLGSFDGNKFNHETQTKRLHYGKNSYAAQSWSDVSTEDARRIRIAWNTFDIPSMPYNMAMNFPCEMKLKTFSDEVFLCTYPVKEIENIYGESFNAQNICLSSDEEYTKTMTEKLYDITFNIFCANKGSFVISVFGLEIHGNIDKNELSCLGNSAPLESFDNSIDLRMLIDVNNIEIFINMGKAFMSIGHIQDYNINRLVFKSINKAIVLKEINIVEIKNIWNKEDYSIKINKQ